MNTYPVDSPAGISLLGHIPVLKRFIVIAGQCKRPICYLERYRLDQLLELHPDFLAMLQDRMSNGDFLGAGTAAELSLAAQCVDVDPEHRELQACVGPMLDLSSQLMIRSGNGLAYEQVIELCNYVARSVSHRDTHLFVTTAHESGAACCQIFCGDGQLYKTTPYIRWLADPIQRADAIL